MCAAWKNRNLKWKKQGSNFGKNQKHSGKLKERSKPNNSLSLSTKLLNIVYANVKANEDAEERVRFEKVAENFRIDLFDATVVAVKQAIIARDKNKKINTWF